MKKYLLLIVAVLLSLVSGFAQTLVEGYEYPEPTHIEGGNTTTADKLGNNRAYSFVLSNIQVDVTMGAQTATYFGCNAGYQMTFTATEPIKAIVINGYVKQNFSATVNHGDIAYVDASDEAVEADPVVVITDIDSKSVTLSCVKQLRCYSVDLYFENNPEDYPGGDLGGDEELTFDYEPTETKTLDITFDEAEYMDLSPYYGYPYTDIYLIAEDYEMELGVFAESVSGTVLAPGVYEINDSYEEGTVQASPGGDDMYDYPSYIATDFEYDEEYDEYMYGTAYYLVSGTLTVASDPAGTLFTIDATTAHGSKVHAIFRGKAIDLFEELVEEGISTVSSVSGNVPTKRFEAGQIVLRHKSQDYRLNGLRR